jgi:hypothetical protein
MVVLIASWWSPGSAAEPRIPGGPPDGWTVAAASLTVAGAAISICLSAPILYKAGCSWWNRLL